MSKVKKIILLGTADELRTEWRVMENIYLNLKNTNDYDVHFFNTRKYFFKVVRHLWSSNYMLIHSPIALNLPYILIGYLFGCKIYGIVWDLYPVRLHKKYYRLSLKRFTKDIIENVLNSLLSKIIIPSSDFENYFCASKVVKMQIWPKIRKLPAFDIDEFKVKESNAIKIIFAGQVNETRGLAESIALINDKVSVPYVIYIAGCSTLLNKAIGHNEFVIFLGELNEFDLIELYKKCNFGLVSLSSGFNGPAFPSKTFDYISFNLPILYFGPQLIDYQSILLGSGVGVKIDSLKNIDFKLYNSMVLNFIEKKNKFEALTCFDVKEFTKIFDS